MENYELGIMIIASGYIGIIEFDTKRYKGYLPGIGSANTYKSALMEKYPDHLYDDDRLKFIYESMILVKVSFSDDFSTIRTVNYSPLDFIKFYNNCFTEDLKSQFAYNENAFYKLSVIPYLEYLIILSGYNFENPDPAQLGYFAAGKAKGNVFALKLHERMNEQEIEYVLNETKSLIEAMDVDKIILASRGFEFKEKISDETKNLICELCGITAIKATEFSYSRPVVSASIYTDYEDNSMNLLIAPSAGGGFDLILVVING